MYEEEWARRKAQGAVAVGRMRAVCELYANMDGYQNRGTGRGTRIGRLAGAWAGAREQDRVCEHRRVAGSRVPLVRPKSTPARAGQYTPLSTRSPGLGSPRSRPRKSSCLRTMPLRTANSSAPAKDRDMAGPALPAQDELTQTVFGAVVSLTQVRKAGFLLETALSLIESGRCARRSLPKHTPGRGLCGGDLPSPLGPVLIVVFVPRWPFVSGVWRPGMATRSRTTSRSTCGPPGSRRRMSRGHSSPEASHARWRASGCLPRPSRTSRPLRSWTPQTASCKDTSDGATW